MVRTTFTTASFGDSLCALHHERAAELTYLTGRLGFDSVFAFRIVGAGEEDAEPSATLHHFSSIADRLTGCAHRARHTRLCARFLYRVFPHIFAFGIVGTGDKAAKSALALNELSVFARRTRLPDIFRRGNFAPVFFAGTEALGKFLSHHEARCARELVLHRPAAYGTGEFLRCVAHAGDLRYFCF